MAATSCVRGVVTGSRRTEGAAARPSQRKRAVQVGAGRGRVGSATVSGAGKGRMPSGMGSWEPERLRNTVIAQRSAKATNPPDQRKAWVREGRLGSMRKGQLSSASMEEKLESA